MTYALSGFSMLVVFLGHSHSHFRGSIVNDLCLTALSLVTTEGHVFDMSLSGLLKAPTTEKNLRQK